MFFHHRSSGLPFRGTSCLGSTRTGRPPPGFYTDRQSDDGAKTHHQGNSQRAERSREYLPISKWLLAKRYRKPFNYIQASTIPEKISHIKNYLFFLKGAQIVIVHPKEKQGCRYHRVTT